MAMVGACASDVATTKGTKPENQKAIETYRPIHRQLKATDTLGSDAINAAYEDKTEAADASLLVNRGDKAEAVLDKEKEFKKILTDEKRKKLHREKKENSAAEQPAKKQSETTKTEIPVVRTEASVAYQATTVFFADGSANVAAEYNDEIRQIARLAKEKNAHVTVYGFASSRTRDMDAAAHKLANFKISLKRAENVAAALVKAGAPKNSVAIEALSDSRPLYSEAMPSGERMNRRAEIYVSY